MANTDVLVGMHGAALAYSILLPPNSAVIELFPSYYRVRNWHMQRMVEAANHLYLTQKLDKSEDNPKTQSTVVKPVILAGLIEKAVNFVFKNRAGGCKGP